MRLSVTLHGRSLGRKLGKGFYGLRSPAHGKVLKRMSKAE